MVARSHDKRSSEPIDMDRVFACWSYGLEVSNDALSCFEVMIGLPQGYEDDSEACTSSSLKLLGFIDWQNITQDKHMKVKRQDTRYDSTDPRSVAHISTSVGVGVGVVSICVGRHSGACRTLARMEKTWSSGFADHVVLEGQSTEVGVSEGEIAESSTFNHRREGLL